MIHPTDDELVAYLDGELPRESAAEMTRHVASCIGCRKRVAELEDVAATFTGAMQVIDASEPQTWENPHSPPAIRVVRRDGLAARTAPRAGRSALPASLRWAAGIAIVAVAGLSASIGTVPRFTGDTAEVPELPVALVAPPVSAPAAVAVLPLDGSVRVQLEANGSSPHLVVRLADRRDVRVSVGGVEAPQFVAREGEVTVRIDADPAKVEIEFPRTIVNGSVWNGRTLVARVEAGRIVPGDAARTTTTPAGLEWRP
jgi:anti-sigma factor RsiW